MRAILIAILVFVSASCQAATNYAASASLLDVQSRVNASARNDTVMVTNTGAVTWSGTLSLTKGVALLGPGTNLTITDTGLAVQFSPDATAIANDEVIRLEGFAFDGGGTSIVLVEIDGTGAGGTKPFNNAVVGRCLFKNGGTPEPNAGIIYVHGQARGCIYSNVFDRCNVVLAAGYGDITDWSSGYYPQSFGTADNMYFEGNLIHYSSAYSAGDPGWSTIGQSCRMAVRYNLYVFTNTSSGELWDVHGFQYSSIPGTMVSEYYRNTVLDGSSYLRLYFRGGWGLIYSNTFATSRDYTAAAAALGGSCASDWGYPSFNTMVTNCYFWSNLWNGTITNMVLDGTYQNCGIASNVNWHNYPPSPIPAYVFPHPLSTNSSGGSSATYYIATNGSSANSGTSIGSAWPWTMIPAVPAGTISSPTLCLVSPGFYTGASGVVLTNSYVTVSNGPALTAVWTNVDDHPFRAIYPAHDITYVGLSFQSNRYSFMCGDQNTGHSVDVSNIVVRNCWFRNTGLGWAGTPGSSSSGIELVAQACTIDGCICESNGIPQIAGQNHGVYAGGQNGIFTNLICRYNNGAGIILNGHNDGGSHDHNNWFRSSLLYSNETGNGYQLVLKDSGNSGTSYVVNNTMSDTYQYAFRVEANCTARLTNNIVLSSGVGFQNSGTVTADYNMAPATLAAAGPHDVITNYFGLDASYRPQTGSPAIGKGLGGLTIGAYQFSSPATTNATAVRQIYILR